MRRLLATVVLGLVTCVSVSFAQLPTVWQKSNATGNLPTWFNTSSAQRNLAYGNVGGKNRLYITYANKTLSPILILDAATGDSVGTLDTTGISGGIFPLNDIEVSFDGVIFAANLTLNAQTSAFKVYKWTSESAAPTLVISYADSAYRLGDHITVTGSTADNSVTIWAAATGKKAVVKFTTANNGASFTPTVIALNDTVTTSATPKVYPAGNDFFVSSAGDGIREYDASGNLLGAVASMPTTIGSMAYIAGGSPMKAYVLGYNYTSAQPGGTPPQFVQVVDVTNGINTADSVAATPVLGTAMNLNGTGDIAVEKNGDGTVTVYVLATNNGLGAFTFNAKLTAISGQGESTPTSYVLSQNYPNPFNPTTQIEYSIPGNSFVTLRVYNVLGQEVATLFSGNRKAGNYSATFDASRFASGVYFYRLHAGSFSSVKKMLLLK